MASFIITILHIYCWIYQWKNLEKSFKNWQEFWLCVWCLPFLEHNVLLLTKQQPLYGHYTGQCALYGNSQLSLGHTVTICRRIVHDLRNRDKPWYIHNKFVVASPWLWTLSERPRSFWTCSKLSWRIMAPSRFYLYSYGSRSSFFVIVWPSYRYSWSFVKNRDCSSYGFPTMCLLWSLVIRGPSLASISRNCWLHSYEIVKSR